MLRAVIIDDESTAINALMLLLDKHVNFVNVSGATTDCAEGIAMIEEHRPEIVFLDINMPDMSGFSLLKQLRYKDFDLIFTTAYERYAIQAIKHHASDYLMKPVDMEELVQAMKNIRETREGKHGSNAGKPRRLEYTGRIGLPVKEGLVYQPVADIIRIESDGNYCTFYTTGARKYIVSKNIGEYEELLPAGEFFRAHKSHLINIQKVKKYIRTDGYFVEMEDGSMVEIARRKKDEFLQVMSEAH